MVIKKLYISKDELNKLKKIGQGTDGKVFKYSDTQLIKLYLEKLYTEHDINNLLNLDDKIYSKDNLVIKTNNEKINYYAKDDEEDIKIRAKDAIIKAIERQEYIKNTNLPNGIVYLDKKFVGCMLKKCNGIQIHKLTGMPMSYKLSIIKNAIDNIEELLNNNVYHIDLNNSPFVKNPIMIDDKVNFEYGHSHILVDPLTKKTNIIDLDGKSTIYTERDNEALLRKCLEGLCILLCEFLYKVNPESKELDEIVYELMENGLGESKAMRFAKADFENINEIKKELKLV